MSDKKTHRIFNFLLFLLREHNHLDELYQWWWERDWDPAEPWATLYQDEGCAYPDYKYLNDEFNAKPVEDQMELMDDWLADTEPTPKEKEPEVKPDVV